METNYEFEVMGFDSSSVEIKFKSATENNYEMCRDIEEE